MIGRWYAESAIGWCKVGEVLGSKISEVKAGKQEGEVGWEVGMVSLGGRCASTTRKQGPAISYDDSNLVVDTPVTRAKLLSD